MANQNIARLIDAVPNVANTSDRDARFPTPDTYQKVYVQSSNTIQQWDGAAWQSIFLGVGTVGSYLYTGTGSPEGVQAANKGSLYLQTDGSNGTIVWTKNSGSGTTGWRLLQTASGAVQAADYGVAWDGTTDDTTNLQAAADAAAGKVLVLPVGNGKITSPITFSAGTVVQGQGMGATTITCSNASAKFWLRAVAKDYVQFRDFKIDCASGGTVGHTGISFEQGSNYGRVERVWMVNVGQYGIVVQDSGTNAGGAGHVFRNNIVDMTNAVDAVSPIALEIFPRGGAGYLANPGALVEGNTILGTTTNRSGIKFDAQRSGRVVNNYLTGVKSASATGAIILVGSRDCVVANNTLYDVGNGITISGTAGPDNNLANSRITVANNDISKYSNIGIYGSVGIDGLKVVNNTIDLNGGSGTRGLKLEQTATGPSGTAVDYTNLQIRGNQFFGGAYLQVVSDAGTSAFGIPRARIESNSFDTPTTWAIQLAGSNSTDVVIASNTIWHGAAAGGITIVNSPGRTKIFGNKVLDCNTGAGAGSVGINVISPNSEVYDNHIENISGGTGSLHTGISINTGTKVSVRKNRIVGMLTASISTTGGGTLTGPDVIGTNRGDADVTLTCWQDAEVQRFTSALTTNRTVTLSTTDAYNGARFTILRESTATGSSTLSIGGLVLLAPGEKATVEYNASSAWQLIGVGSIAGATTPNSHTATAPAGTTSATAVMMAVGGAITPGRSSKILVVVSGQMANGTAGDGATVDLRYGTGTAPTNGAAVTGTLLGVAQTNTSVSAAQKSGFCLTGIITNAAIGTALWFDVSLLAVTGGTATITGVTATAVELP